MLAAFVLSDWDGESQLRPMREMTDWSSVEFGESDWSSVEILSASLTSGPYIS